MRTHPEQSEVSARVADFVQDLFRHGTQRWSLPTDKETRTAFVSYAHDQGVQPLLYEILHTGDLGGWPPDVMGALRRESQKRVAIAARREEEWRTLSERFAQAGVEMLLFKGVALAYQVYPLPYLRPSIDTDILVPKSKMPAVRRVLRAEGYHPLPGVDGDLVLQQATFQKGEEDGLTHTVDAHWAVSYRQLFARSFPGDELLHDAVSIPELGKHVRAPGLPHALLLACMHRVGHHVRKDRLQWLYDIHLLWGSMCPGEREKALRLAKAKKVCAIVADGLEGARTVFGTCVDSEATGRLARASDEPSAIYLRADLSGWDEMRMDLMALSSWKDRAQLLKEHLVPSTAYLRARFPDQADKPVAWLYARRGLQGLKKLKNPRRTPAGRP